MKEEDLIQKSIFIITEYYRNQLNPFFESITDDVLWIGPRDGQIMQGKDRIIRTWTEAETNLLFSMGNINAHSVSTGRNNLEVLLEYYVYTHFPSGEIDKHHQRLHLSWGFRNEEENGRRRLVPKICMIHISNIPDGEMDEGQVYADSSAVSQIDAAGTRFSRVSFRNVYGKDANEVTWYFNSATILWIESTDGGRHSVIHTTEGDHPAIERLRYFEENFSDVLVRIHASYLVNPLYVRSIRRFELTLTDGTALSIPQKKYTAVRKRLADWSIEMGGRENQIS